jgi:hypothetical protein
VPNGCAAAPQHGHDPGRASAQDGIAIRQDLIPSGLAINLVELRSPVSCEARRRGRAPLKTRPLRHQLLARALLRAAPYRTPPPADQSIDIARRIRAGAGPRWTSRRRSR